MKTTISFYLYAPYGPGKGMEDGLEKATPPKESFGPPPLGTKKLNFCNTLGRAGSLTTEESGAPFLTYTIGNQHLIGIMIFVSSITENNKYNLENFKFGQLISKNGGVISNYFQVFSNYFQEISNYFQWISKRNWVKTEKTILIHRSETRLSQSRWGVYTFYPTKILNN